MLKTDLDAISGTHGKDIDRCFIEMLTEWLKKVNPRPSWSAMIAALAMPDVNFQELAENLKIKYNSESSKVHLPESTPDELIREDLEVKSRAESKATTLKYQLQEIEGWKNGHSGSAHSKVFTCQCFLYTCI